MAIEIENREGDYVLKGSGIDLLRIHVSDDEMIISSAEYPRMRVIATLLEMKELRDWLTRRLEEEI